MTTETPRTAVLVMAMTAGVATMSLAQPTPATVGETLLAAEKAFAAAAAQADPVTALTAMFDPEVIMPGPPGTLHRGIAAVTAALRANPDNLGGRLEWTPIRLGLSADGMHGFTFGFMTQRKADGTTLPLKYMAYWLKGASGWKVLGYKRARRPEGEVSMAPMAPLLPAALVAARTGPVDLELVRSLSAAERAFSNEAQSIGLGPAFTKWGSDTAVNMGGPDSPGYVVGPVAIGKAVGAGSTGKPSPVSWSTEMGVVASSGDLGISFGYIRPNGAPPPGAPPNGSPFFTIWYRASPAGPWRYIAE